ncbi:MAG TPA: hypothetical protein VJS92_16135, partial [Candidatus Polarisedimenticolaceae bacterium]|nr:hypothetical protein [Candidatus Polarisedimenticolaceae bacterium]
QRRLRACLAASFAQRRRTLANNLRSVWPDPGELRRRLERAGLDGALRAEQVPPEGFRRLAAVWDMP